MSEKPVSYIGDEAVGVPGKHAYEFKLSYYPPVPGSLSVWERGDPGNPVKVTETQKMGDNLYLAEFRRVTTDVVLAAYDYDPDHERTDVDKEKPKGLTMKHAMIRDVEMGGVFLFQSPYQPLRAWTKIATGDDGSSCTGESVFSYAEFGEWRVDPKKVQNKFRGNRPMNKDGWPVKYLQLHPNTAVLV